MPYYKKKQKKINGKWYPQSVTVGDPVTTDEIAQLLADFSSASVGDTYNILKNLARAMSIYMSNGRSVKLDGVGTFYYTLTAAGQGVDTPEEVNANQIVGVRVRFLPEYSRASDHTATRALVPDKLKWEEWGGEATGSTPPAPAARTATTAAKAPSADADARERAHPAAGCALSFSVLASEVTCHTWPARTELPASSPHSA